MLNLKETGVVIVVVVTEDACLTGKVRAHRKQRQASFCKPSPHPAVTVCSICCIADTVWSGERGGALGERGGSEHERGRGSV